MLNRDRETTLSGRGKIYNFALIVKLLKEYILSFSPDL